MVFINSAPKPPQTTLKIVKNFLLLSIIIILPKHSLIQSLNVIVSHFLVMFINFGPTTNIKITKPPFPYLIAKFRYFYMHFRLTIIIMENMDTNFKIQNMF